MVSVQKAEQIKAYLKNELETNPTLAVVGRVKDWISPPRQTTDITNLNDDDDTWDNISKSRYPVSCTVLSVEDSMEGENGIEYSWLYVSKGLRYGAGVALDLSKLRPNGTSNNRGLIASGLASFCKIYSVQNEILRKGGVFKNGAVVAYCDASHPDILEFINLKASDIPWIKRAVYVDDNPNSPDYILNNPHLSLILDAVRAGTVWLAKKRWYHPETKKSVNYPSNPDNIWENRLFSQVCVTGDTWVTTSYGARQVKDLVGNVFEAHLNGKNYLSVQPPVVHEYAFPVMAEPSGIVGFFSTGENDVYEVHTQEGFKFKATKNHLVSTSNGMVAVENLVPGSKLLLNNCELEWKGKGTFEEGWMLGSLIGDGTFASDSIAQLKFWGDFKEVEGSYAQEYVQSLGASSRGTSVYPLPQLQRRDEFSLINSTKLAELAQQFSIVKGNKVITEDVEKASYSFYCGFLRGYFDADSTVQGSTERTNGKSISLTSTVRTNLEAVQRMLLRLGIMSRICKGQAEGYNSLPDGKGSKKEFPVQQSWRLIISGKSNLVKYLTKIGYHNPAKHLRLQEITESYTKTKTNERKKTAVVTQVVYAGKEVTYDCAIEDVHKFDANGVVVSNCLEILLRSNATCTLSHINLGQVNLDNMVKAFVNGMKFLCELHKVTGAGKNNYYLPTKEDRQVGLGVVGLANMLANMGISYRNFTDCLYDFLTQKWYEFKGIRTSYRHAKSYIRNELYGYKEFRVVYELYEAFQAAAKVARRYKMERAFTVAPTASCSYRHVDSRGYTLTPEISPPICHPITKKSVRDSDTMGVQEYQYPPEVETAESVSWEVYYKLAKSWQMLMENTGLAHAISFNIWNQCPVDEEWFKNWLDSPLVTTYYRMLVDQDFMDKTSINAGLDEELSDDFFETDLTEREELTLEDMFSAVLQTKSSTTDTEEVNKDFCSIENTGFCAACAE